MKKLFRTKNLLSEQFLSPSFIEHDGCVFLACQFSEKSYRRCLEMHKDSPTRQSAVEVSMNHVHVNQLFLNAPAKVTPRLAKEAGERISAAWKLKLRLDFPNRKFKVCFSVDDPPEVSEISFHQVHSEKTGEK
jgi:hypothetical protein